MFLDTDQKSFSSLVSKDILNDEAKYELNIIVERENKLNRDGLIYKAGNKEKDKTNDFQKLKTIISFGREIYNDNLSQDDGLEQQVRLKGDTGFY